MKSFLVSIVVVLSGTLTTSCDIQQTVSASFAKEYCSCRFVEEQDDKYCAEYAKKIIKVKSYEINFEKKTVWARGLGKESIADYNAETGCRLRTK